MKKLIFFTLIFTTGVIYSQDDTMYLLVENPKFNFGCEKDLAFGFLINSTDERFISDYYYFGMQNAKGFDGKGEIEYYDLKEFSKEVKIDTVRYETISSLTKNKKWWEIHNELSLKKHIFLIDKRNEGINNNTGKYLIKYYVMPMIYEGTRKNIVPTNL
ncbi:hypothetical protein [Mesonia sp.]|uniref:hypothetical protein n=1 Tax=Mesonia sp. TaxID=1960830 RepID=UPI003F975FBC